MPCTRAAKIGCRSIGILLALIVAIGPALAYEPADLATVESNVVKDYPDVAQMTPDAFASLAAAGKPVVVFDVREEAEFQVSRIPGAIRVDPGAWGFRFVDQHAAAAAGKTVVFYCSVGVRSSKLAARVKSGLMSRGAAEVYNLQGGIFRWHNERRALVDRTGETPLVHPYDKTWGGLVARQSDVATEPRRAD